MKKRRFSSENEEIRRRTSAEDEEIRLGVSTSHDRLILTWFWVVKKNSHIHKCVNKDIAIKIAKLIPVDLTKNFNGWSLVLSNFPSWMLYTLMSNLTAGTMDRRPHQWTVLHMGRTKYCECWRCS